MFSIVYGRLYTAMHSFTDCAVGVLLGAAIWVLWLFYGDALDHWVKYSGYIGTPYSSRFPVMYMLKCHGIVPATVIPFCLLAVHWHPEPVDDCPCFEDAIAFVSVVMGQFVARWYMEHYGFDESFFARPMPGASWATWSDVGTWWSTAAIKMVIGMHSFSS